MKKHTSQTQILLQKIQIEKEKRTQLEALGSRTTEPNLKGVSDALDRYYFVHKMSLYCAFLSYQNIVQADIIPYQESDLLLIKEIMQQIDAGKFSLPLLLLYNQIRKLLESIAKSSKKMDELFDTTLEGIQQHERIHSKEESLELYSLLNNYCIRRMNDRIDKKKTYRLKFVRLNNSIINLRYKGMARKKIKMQTSLFRNMVVVALSIDEADFFHNLSTHCLKPNQEQNGFSDKFEWAEKFIEFYSTKLDDSKQTAYYVLYCKVFLEFERKCFNKAYKLLANRMRIQGIFLNLDIKLIHLKILYELCLQKPQILVYDEIEIRKVLDAYRKLVDYELSNKQQISYHVSYYQNFIKIYKKLFSFYKKYNGQLLNSKEALFIEKKEKLKCIINENDYSYNPWLLEKLENIK